MAEHAPIERTHGNGFSVDCTCGDRDVIWSTLFGARVAYLEHAAQEIANDANWGGTVTYVDYDETDD